MKPGELRFLLFYGLFLLCTRIPFLFDGYGSEEDAWALPLVAERIALSGHYEVSRLPGHPLQEILYSSIWTYGPLAFTVLTALISTAGILAFYKMLKDLGLASAFWCSLALAFTPVVYIHSTNAMDYTWAMAFLLAAGYFTGRKQVWLAGGMLAMAVACRITSGAMLFPYTLLLWRLSDEGERVKNILRFHLAALAGSLLLFSPVWINYGTSFFTYYEHFPLPGFAKNFYKASIGVWGTIGCLTLLSTAVYLLVKKPRLHAVNYRGKDIAKPLLWCSLLTLLLYLLAFIQVPLKSAFLIPLVPFVLLIFALYLGEKANRNIALLMLCSSFFMGLNLAEAHRGSAKSTLALEFEVAGVKVAADLLQGPVPADRSKRLQRTAFARSVLQATDTIRTKTVILAGWWLADLLVLQKGKENPRREFRYYVDEAELRWLQARGYRLYYLEDQGAYNDLRFRKNMTDRYAKKLDFASGNQHR